MPSNHLAEYSVVYTERGLNHMSVAFQQVMCDLNQILTATYQAEQAVIIPGGGSYAMESVARQIARDKKILILRNGWFSYRWTQILERGAISHDIDVLTAYPEDPANLQSTWQPHPLEDVLSYISEHKPDLIFAPHIETSSGIRLPEEYIRAVAKAAHDNNGLFVLDCIASGANWVNMQQTGVDILISAPQKGWSAPPCAGFVMLSERGNQAIDNSESDSFSNDLKQWRTIMRAYLDGGHAYHATMPTNALAQCRDEMQAAVDYGLNKLSEAQIELGTQIRNTLVEAGYPCVAADGWQANGVIVCHTTRDDFHNGSAFKNQGMQIAGGVPLACNEPEGFKTFRIGLFGLDKWQNVASCVEKFKSTLEQINIES
ncbi:aminotransferase class V-fold PLP-dependent enzyme [Suttonella sp. R2A3]|uniref:aminotransferase class V-fold PLP-dependent enzyme n=1 Tax=Suttonella sp. R2A3 TaxID=2908648 RepID=UPI001F34B0B3|nr:aminotransferase class V-fold PLP-dependent enzyme [Suttonella sp. R2A3]UJF24344.1 aminotransferase class V-fold PLP-dependent enzyme [Suttonella sp. R2A3]